MRPAKSGGRRFGWLGTYTVLYLIFLYLPPALLPLFSFNDSIYIAFPLSGFTTQWYLEMFSAPQLIDSFWNSVRVGAIVAVISTVFGTLAAKATTRYRLWGRKPLLAVVMLPILIPEIVLGISLLTSINTLGVPLSLYTIGIAHVVICTPFSMLVMTARMEGFDRSMEEAALDLGENAWMTFWRVTFPLIFPGVLASLLLTFTISFDDFIVAFFVAGDQATLPIYIWSQLRFPTKLPQVLALGALILMGSFVLVALAQIARQRGVQVPGKTTL